MSNGFRNQLYQNLNQKDTDELLEIWRDNDLTQWTNTAFEVIYEILQERIGEVPAQSEPIYKHEQKITNEKEPDENILSAIILARENPPVFYRPQQVLKIYKWLNYAAIVAVAITAISGLLQSPNTQRLVVSFFVNNYSLNFETWSLISWGITLIIVVMGIVLQGIIIYFPLKVLAYILKVLMEMEFDSQ